MYDEVVSINGHPFPAWRRPWGLVVDLRVLGPDLEPHWFPQALDGLGLDPELLDAAANAQTPGVLWFPVPRGVN